MASGNVPGQPITRSISDGAARKLRSGLSIPDARTAPSSPLATSPPSSPRAGRSRDAPTGSRTAASPPHSPTRVKADPQEQHVAPLKGTRSTLGGESTVPESPRLRAGESLMAPGELSQQLAEGEAAQDGAASAGAAAAGLASLKLPAAAQPRFTYAAAELPASRGFRTLEQPPENDGGDGQLPRGGSGGSRKSADLTKLQPSSSRLQEIASSQANQPVRHSSGAASRPSSSSDRVTRRELKGSRLAHALAEAAREAEQKLHEDEVLRRAAEVGRLHRAWRKPPAAEPKREEGHWDHLLKEMQFMAKSFAWERKEHMRQARQVARAAARSNLDITSREKKRALEEEHRTRKRAGFIAKEVRKFWGKVEKIVAYKHQSLVDSRKKDAMDKHLSFLLGQTQRYSSLLAQRLSNNASDAALSSGNAQLQLQAAPDAAAGAALDAAAANLALGDPRAVPPPPDADDSAAAPRVQPPSAADTQLDRADMQPDAADAQPAAADVSDEDEGMEVLSQDGGDDSTAGDQDYMTREEEQADDEATLDEEEAIQQAEGAAPDPTNELSELEAEAEMPLEQLLAAYGYVLPGQEAAAEAEAAAPAAAAASSRSRQARRGAAVAAEVAEASSEQPEAAASKAEPISDPPEDLEDLQALVSSSDSDADGHVPGARGSHAGDGDYVMAADSEADDEATLEEEEAAAQQEAGEAEGAELAELQADADLPIEALMARYGYVQPGAEHEADGSLQPEENPLAAEIRQTSTAAQAVDPQEAADEPVPAPPAAVAAASNRSRHARGRAAAVPEAGEKSPAQAQEASLSAEAPMLDEEEDDLAELASSVDSESDADDQMPASATARDKDYVMAADSEADDEATLEEEEAAAQQEADEAEGAELAELQADADMPIEQLMARYGYVQPGADPEAGASLQPEEKLPSAAGPTLENDEARPMDIDASADPAGQVLPAAASAPAADSRPKADARPAAAGGFSEGAPAASTAAEAAARGNMEDESAPEGLDGQTEDNRVEGAAALASAAQPTGHTLQTTSVGTQVPFLLRGSLREYQHIGLDWLVTIYKRRLNGILADEMGLGKTIMTIALLAWLACEEGVWGPHLVVVPTSVMLNWEMECKKWCPAFKLLTYYGSARERALKRQGWSKPNAFHICITSYNLILSDAKMFRRKRWKYLILDEAHMIKNWKSMRWQTLLNFNSKRRLLITGTPLQNDLMELWSLMHFLMPQVFASHAQFKDWFSNPLSGMVEGDSVNKGVVERLHGVLRPFLLRRLKSEVEKQLPHKHEHVLRCRLSRRQRALYEDYMASSDTKERLSSGGFLGILNVLMQLRKVCNHPDLFEGRPIVSAFDMPPLSYHLPSPVLTALAPAPWASVSPALLRMASPPSRGSTAWRAALTQELAPSAAASQELLHLRSSDPQTGAELCGLSLLESLAFLPSPAAAQAAAEAAESQSTLWAAWRRERRRALLSLSTQRVQHCRPVMGRDLAQLLLLPPKQGHVHSGLSQDGVPFIKPGPSKEVYWQLTHVMGKLVRTAAQRAADLEDDIKAFMIAIPKARAPVPQRWVSHPDQTQLLAAARCAAVATQQWQEGGASLSTALVRQRLFFPDRRLIQYDCGKLQELEGLLRRLKAQGSRALIFTQMARMLDILEVWLNLHAFTYLRLDGSTKPEQRQALMQQFNASPKVLVFILSTRSGGVGMNLTGADTVIFYDSDWNPAMDAQAQDRCHRIGQTREVHIYRLVSERTVEENILMKSDQKRQLDYLAIQSGGFNTDFLQKFNPRDLLGAAGGGGPGKAEDMRAAMQAAEDEGDAAAAAAAERETAAELAEFSAEPSPGPAAEAGDGAGQASGDAGLHLPGPVDRADSAGEDTSRLPPSARPSPAPAPSGGAGMVMEIGDEAEVEADVAALAGPAAGRQNALAQLESSLRPVERYAIRFLEESKPAEVEVEAVTAAVEQELDAQEWNMQEMERMQQAQEEEMEEEGEAQRLAVWDRAAADAAFQAQRAQALQQQAELDAQLQAEAEAYERAAMERLAVPTYDVMAFSRTRRSGKSATPVYLDEAESPRPGWGLVTRKKRSRPNEDHVPVKAEWNEKAGDMSWRGKRGRTGSGEVEAGPLPTKRRRSGATEPLRPLNAPAHPTSPSALPVAPAQGPAGSSLPYWLPWEALEDLVLCSVVLRAWEGAQGLPSHTSRTEPSDALPGTRSPLGQGESWTVPEDVFGVVRNMLAAGADQLSLSAAQKALNQGTKRPQQECKARYLMLLRAQAQARLKAAGAQPQENGDVKAAPGPAQTLNDLITLRERLAALIATRHVCHRTALSERLLEAGRLAAQDALPGNGGQNAISGSPDAIRALLAEVSALLSMAKDKGLDSRHIPDHLLAATLDQPLQVEVEEMLSLFEAVKRGAGHPARGVQRYLGATLTAMHAGGTQAAFKALVEQIQSTPATEAAVLAELHSPEASISTSPASPPSSQPVSAPTRPPQQTSVPAAAHPQQRTAAAANGSALQQSSAHAPSLPANVRTRPSPPAATAAQPTPTGQLAQPPYASWPAMRPGTAPTTSQPLRMAPPISIHMPMLHPQARYPHRGTAPPAGNAFPHANGSVQPQASISHPAHAAAAAATVPLPRPPYGGQLGVSVPLQGPSLPPRAPRQAMSASSVSQPAVSLQISSRRPSSGGASHPPVSGWQSQPLPQAGIAASSVPSQPTAAGMVSLPQPTHPQHYQQQQQQMPASAVPAALLSMVQMMAPWQGGQGRPPGMQMDPNALMHLSQALRMPQADPATLQAFWAAQASAFAAQHQQQQQQQQQQWQQPQTQTQHMQHTTRPVLSASTPSPSRLGNTPSGQGTGNGEASAPGQLLQNNGST